MSLNGEAGKLREGSSGRALRLVSALSLAALLTPASCGDRTVTEDDCHKIADHLREAWAAETKGVSSGESPTGAKAAAVVKGEGEKLVGGWSAECRDKLVGTPADTREMKCLLGAKTLSELRLCSATK